MNLKKYLSDPKEIIIELNNRGILLLSDKMYLKLKYKKIFNKDMNLKNPKTFNEKIQWLKLNDRKPEYSKMVDKYEAKEYVGNIIGKQYIIRSLGIYDRFDEIDFDKLPNQFVIKCTHDFGGIVIVKDKKELDIECAKRTINRHLKKNFYVVNREWVYKNVKPRIIIEEYMEDKKQCELIDYKIYSFNGKCDYVMACFDRQKVDTKFIYYDKNWNIKKEFSNDGKKYGETINLEKPKNLDKMFEFARKLSKGIPFVRVDFYEANGNLYFGELTFYPAAGFDNTRTKEVQEYLDNSLDLEELINEKNRVSNK